MPREWAIGVDVGGTKIAAGLVESGSGRVLARVEVPTAMREGGDAVLRRASGAIAAMRQAARDRGHPLRGVGLGVPELVSNEGKIASAWNFEWRGIDLAAALREDRLVVESDVRAAALAELRHGHGRGLASFALIVVGTGLSYALCVDGRIHRGARGFAIHFASSDQQPVCAHCGRQGPFNLEGLASAGGLAATYARRTGAPPSDLAAMIDDAGDAEGVLLFEQATRSLAAGLGQIVNMLDPQALVLSGGLSRSPRFVAALARQLPEAIFAVPARETPLLTSALGADGGIIGAACAIFEPA